MAREINLVPDIKDEMIRALKLRNFIFFLCIVVSAGAIAVALIFGGIAGGQRLALDNKKEVLSLMSNTVNGYADMGDFLTIQNQVNKLGEIEDNKNLLSRTFNILLAMQPTNGDTVEISELVVDLDESTISFEAQANAETEPYIDYNVLDAFKKSMNYLTYDYGTYVDKYGEDIPAYCIIENDLNGTFFSEDNNLYAYWTIDRDGCNPSAGREDEETNLADTLIKNELEEKKESELEVGTGTASESETEQTPAAPTEKFYEDEYEYELNEATGEWVVRIWRTPQFDDWKEKGYMDLNGNITNVAHFESECVSYNGVQEGEKIKWEKTNDQCMLVKDGEDGINITESSNGIDASDQLVLRFSSVINIEPEVYRFKNHHMITFGPSGSYNVTDSYTQIQNMFTERAADVIEEEE